MLGSAICTESIAPESGVAVSQEWKVSDCCYGFSSNRTDSRELLPENRIDGRRGLLEDRSPLLRDECMGEVGDLSAEIRHLSAPLSKEQLIDIISRAAPLSNVIRELVNATVNASPAARRIMVRNIHYNTSDNQFYEQFAQFGLLEDAAIVREKCGRSKGFGFVTFKTMTAMKNCLRSSLHLDGRKLFVKVAADPFSEFLSDGAPIQGRMTRRKIFIRNLPPLCDPVQLRAAFEGFGSIEDCAVVMDPRGKSRGFAFITYHSQESAVKAAAEPQQAFQDRVIFVSIAKSGIRQPHTLQSHQQRGPCAGDSTTNHNIPNQSVLSSQSNSLPWFDPNNGRCADFGRKNNISNNNIALDAEQSQSSKSPDVHHFYRNSDRDLDLSHLSSHHRSNNEFMKSVVRDENDFTGFTTGAPPPTFGTGVDKDSNRGLSNILYDPWFNCTSEHLKQLMTSAANMAHNETQIHANHSSELDNTRTTTGNITDNIPTIAAEMEHCEQATKISNNKHSPTLTSSCWVEPTTFLSNNNTSRVSGPATEPPANNFYSAFPLSTSVVDLDKGYYFDDCEHFTTDTSIDFDLNECQR